MCSVLHEKIPKNLIQPFVENALFHGLVDEETGAMNGEIRISIKNIKQRLAYIYSAGCMTIESNSGTRVVLALPTGINGQETPIPCEAAENSAILRAG